MKESRSNFTVENLVQKARTYSNQRELSRKGHFELSDFLSIALDWLGYKNGSDERAAIKHDTSFIFSEENTMFFVSNLDMIDEAISRINEPSVTRAPAMFLENFKSIILEIHSYFAIENCASNFLDVADKIISHPKIKPEERSDIFLREINKPWVKEKGFNDLDIYAALQSLSTAKGIDEAQKNMFEHALQTIQPILKSALAENVAEVASEGSNITEQADRLVLKTFSFLPSAQLSGLEKYAASAIEIAKSSETDTKKIRVFDEALRLLGAAAGKDARRDSEETVKLESPRSAASPRGFSDGPAAGGGGGRGDGGRGHSR